MATINLGNIKFKWQGAYNGATSYTLDDVVSYNGSSYICIQASTGNLPTDTAYWEQMSQAGTNGSDGTDLSTTLTTQGDILYRDGSGLQRLGAGTSGQLLQTGGTGANPSWTTFSSDYVKLSSTSNISDVASIDFNGLFSSTYDFYEIYVNGVQWQNGSANELCGRFATGASYTYQTGSIYSSAVLTGYIDYNGTKSTTTSGGVYNQNRFNFCRSFATTNNGKGADFTFTLFQPSRTNTYQRVMCRNFCNEGTNDNIYLPGLAGGNWASNTAVTGFQIFASSGNMDANSVAIYGLKI